MRNRRMNNRGESFSKRSRDRFLFFSFFFFFFFFSLSFCVSHFWSIWSLESGDARGFGREKRRERANVLFLHPKWKNFSRSERKKEKKKEKNVPEPHLRRNLFLLGMMRVREEWLSSRYGERKQDVEKWEENIDNKGNWLIERERGERKEYIHMYIYIYIHIYI